MIALLCPTRARPEQFKRMCRSASNTAKLSRYIYVAVSLEDKEFYHQQWNIIITPDGMPTVHKWNLLAQEAMKVPEVKFFMLASDDMIFSTPRWDKSLLDHYSALENKIHVYALRDSRDPLGTPHPIVTREWITALGYFIPPLFLHWFGDTWTVEIAKFNGCFTHLTDYELIHDKPSDKGNADETHNHIRRMGWHERDKYVNDTCQHFLEHEKRRLAKIIMDNHHRKYRASLGAA